MKNSFFKIAFAEIKYSVTLMILALIVIAAGCKKDLSTGSSGNFSRSSSASLVDSRDIPDTTQTIPNIINANTTLTNDRVWILNGPTFVTNNAVLTIQAGTYIKGVKKATPTSKPSFLVITRGAQLIANGTEANPIVFTSNGAACSRTPGDWGGVVLLGTGRTNAGIQPIEGMQSAYVTDLGLPYPSTIQYGDSDDNTSSGSLQYVRIEFAGDVITEGNELNGLTLGAVGYNTILDHIQVSYGADDGFEFFGGAANARYLISYGNNDDDFDFDQGYQGTIQFAVSVKIPCLEYSPSPNGIESNNITSPIAVTDPSRLTAPVLANFTILGESTSDGPGSGGTPTAGTGTLFRVNSSYTVRNFIVGGFYTGSDISGGTPGSYDYSLVHGYNAALVGTYGSNVTSYINTNPNGSLLLVNPFNVSNCTTCSLDNPAIPDFRYRTIGAASPAATRGQSSLNTAVSVSHPGGVFPSATSLTNTAYAGAFPAQTVARWDDNWATYTPQANPYL